MAMSDKTKMVIKYVQAHEAENLTAADIATALGVDKKVVDGVWTSGCVKKGYGTRVEAEIELDSGMHKAIKVFQLTPEGRALDVDSLE